MHLFLYVLPLAGLAYAGVCPSASAICGVSQIETSKKDYCGQHGSVKNIRVSQATCVTSFEACRDSCLESSKCNSFRFVTGKNQCTLFSQAISSSKFEANPKSPAVFYNKRCFSNPSCLQPTDTAFCSSYLGVQTVSKTITSTSTLTSTVPSTKHTATTTIVISQVTVTTTDSVTVTTPAPTCQTVATTYTATSSTATPQQLKAGGFPRIGVQQRDPSPSPTTPSCLQGLPATAISKACSCQTISTTTATSTISKTVTKSTTTVATTVTATITKTNTINPTTTGTTLTFVQPTQGTFNGLNYYQYFNDYDYADGSPLFDASDVSNNPNYNQFGQVQNIDDIGTIDRTGGGNSSCLLPGQSSVVMDCTQVTVVMQGFFYAATAGPYTLTVPDTIDNGAYAWSGDNALGTVWTNDNEDFSAERIQASMTSGSATYALAAGELLPVTIIWVNGGDVGFIPFTITTPDGTTTSDTTGFFVPPCDTGNPFTP